MATIPLDKFDLISMRASICYFDDVDEAVKLSLERLSENGAIYIRILFADSPYFRFRVGTIAGRVSDACTVLMSEKALLSFLKTKGLDVVAKHDVPYPVHEILYAWKIPAFLRRLVMPLLNRFVMPKFAPDYSLIVATRNTPAC